MELFQDTAQHVSAKTLQLQESIYRCGVFCGMHMLHINWNCASEGESRSTEAHNIR